MRIKKGDTVQVIAGKDKGKSGKVLRVMPTAEKVIVEDVNVAKRHQRPTQKRSHGQIVEKLLPVHVSNVALIDPKTKKPTRVKIVKEGGKSVRMATKSGAKLD